MHTRNAKNSVFLFFLIFLIWPIAETRHVHPPLICPILLSSRWAGRVGWVSACVIQITVAGFNLVC